MTSIDLPPKAAGEIVREEFDFLSLLSVGETLSSATCTVTVYSGVDASPSSLLSGIAVISGTKVRQLVQGGEVGVTYALVCEALTSLSETLQLSAYLVVTE